MLINLIRRFDRVATALLFCLVSWISLAQTGCGDQDVPLEFSRKVVPIVDVPAPVMKVAKSTLPGTEFTEAWKNVNRDGKLHSYEIRGKTSNGKVREARVTPEGKVLETE